MLDDKDLKVDGRYRYQDLGSGPIEVRVTKIEGDGVFALIEGPGGYEKRWAIDTFKRYATKIV
jgi:hypothetical protein